MYTSQVPIAKITPPRQKPYVLRRPALARKLRLLRHASLCVFHAGTGYGKTTAMATFLADEGKDPCWYMINEEDVDFAFFLYGLIMSIRRVSPQFGQSILDDLAAHSVPNGPWSSIAERFVREFVLIQSEHLIVLDDYHHIPSGSDVDRFVHMVVGIWLSLVKRAKRFISMNMMSG
jgi:LuxR family maltose regulon positive regulatory protein